MKAVFKKITIPVASAVLGGAIVLAGLHFSPSLSRKLVASDSQQKQGRSAPLGIDDIVRKQADIDNDFNSFFNDDFFGQRDPFEQMKKMRKEMEQRMENFGKQSNTTKNPFDFWYSNKFGGGSIEDISKREDDNFVYYDIKVENLNLTSINTKVENGNISITGSVEKKEDSGDKDGSSSRVYFRSTFARSFPLPEGVDANKMETNADKDKITLKFPKLKT